ncbi:hypothetical protein [Pseudoxanthomonas japonensis]|jgi:hypothetical protein|uniref:hypothetical protein n=1 Tax=Pseudoxanthomonas japonensis TaxID=69284 RepID=UPI001BCFEACF|nr:hypothetical protein [Pseudoxanthomonas japonensis]
MPSLLVVFALLAAVLSAAGLYAGSRHCRWPRWRRLGRAGSLIGALLAVASLALWVRTLGAGAGACAMLGTWMFAMMALPYVAGMRVAADARSDG